MTSPRRGNWAGAEEAEGIPFSGFIWLHTRAGLPPSSSFAELLGPLLMYCKKNKMGTKSQLSFQASFALLCRLTFSGISSRQCECFNLIEFSKLDDVGVLLSSVYRSRNWGLEMSCVMHRVTQLLSERAGEPSLPGFSVHGDSPGKNTGVGSHSLLRGIFLTQGLNPGLLHCRKILYHLRHQGSPLATLTFA